LALFVLALFVLALTRSPSERLFEPSTITHDGDSTGQDVSVRDSSVALIPRTETVRCIERRASSLQGWREDVWIERLRTQRYESTQHYAHHFDWGSGARGWGRVSSMMVWVTADGVEGGGTEFPLLKRKKGAEWCQWVECREEEEGNGNGDGDSELGVIFKPVAGNAVL
jgi:prolyl 4-hydroxylase